MSFYCYIIVMVYCILYIIEFLYCSNDKFVKNTSIPIKKYVFDVSSNDEEKPVGSVV